MSNKHFLKLLFAEKGKKQLQVCRNIRIHQSTLSLVINGWRPLPLKYLEPLAKELEVSVKNLKDNIEIK